MRSLEETFGYLKAKGEKALVLFVTAGDPSVGALPDILATLQEGGADVIELGIPFSDPIADGPTIQASSQRALEAGATPRSVLEAVGLTELQAPLVAMGYYNPILRYGLDQFAADSKKAGVSGALVVDLTPEEASPWLNASRRMGLDTIFLAAPTSTDARLDEVCSRSSGFVYAVSRTGVTGTLDSLPADVSTLVGRVKSRTNLPVCVGFGVSNPEQVRTVCQIADGVVIGSWVVELLHREWNGGRGKAVVVDQIRAMKNATREL